MLTGGFLVEMMLQTLGAAVLPAGLLCGESARGGRAELGLVLYFNSSVLHTPAQ